MLRFAAAPRLGQRPVRLRLCLPRRQTHWRSGRELPNDGR
jgi:hypothetical protein